MKLPRRQFIKTSLLTAASASLATSLRAAPATPTSGMLCTLSPGSIGVRADQHRAIDLAAQHGFDAVEPYADFLASLDASAMPKLLADLAQKKLVWGAAGLPVEFRRDDTTFQDQFAKLPRLAAAMKKAGATRFGTWISPAHDELAFMENQQIHSKRLRQVAQCLQDHGLRLGLEYVGTLTLRNRRKYPFIHSLKETRDLIADIAMPNVGVVLDTWHWHMARETTADLLTLKASDVVAVDLNDAPKGLTYETYQDGQRELPGATGILDAQGFLGALRQIGFHGPVRAEPFNKTLNDMDDDPACAATIQALRRVMSAKS